MIPGSPLFYRPFLLYGSRLHDNLSPNIGFTMRMNLIGSLVLAVLFAVTSGIAQAKIYKWVDENGITQYTQQPPPKGSATEVNVPAAPSAPPAEQLRDLQDHLEALNKRQEEELRSEQETEAQRADREQLAADCKRIREQLAVVSNNPRLMEESEDGTRIRMTEERRQERIALAKQQLQEHCSDI